jgi:hypothetical protein
MRGTWRRSELLLNKVENREVRKSDGHGQLFDIILTKSTEVIFQHFVENQIDRLIRWESEVEHTELGLESTIELGSTSDGGTHGSDHLYIHDLSEWTFDGGSIEPTTVFEALFQKLNGRLTTVLISFGHVEIIDEDETLFGS